MPGGLVLRFVGPRPGRLVLRFGLGVKVCLPLGGGLGRAWDTHALDIGVKGRPFLWERRPTERRPTVKTGVKVRVPLEGRSLGTAWDTPALDNGVKGRPFLWERKPTERRPTVETGVKVRVPLEGRTRHSLGYACFE